MVNPVSIDKKGLDVSLGMTITLKDEETVKGRIMKGWMKGRKNEWMNERKEEWMNEWILWVNKVILTQHVRHISSSYFLYIYTSTSIYLHL